VPGGAEVLGRFLGCVVCSRGPADAAASRLRGPDVVVWGPAAAAAVAAGGARHVRRLVQAAQGAATLLLLQSVQGGTFTFRKQYQGRRCGGYWCMQLQAKAL
jgi:hypothetical protein